jgi:hypothetical protein
VTVTSKLRATYTRSQGKEDAKYTLFIGGKVEMAPYTKNSSHPLIIYFNALKLILNINGRVKSKIASKQPLLKTRQIVQN